jgi:enoyl-CoA hydratase/carnithine racemase
MGKNINILEGMTEYDEGLSVLREHHVVSLTINRPEDMNRMNLSFLKRLHEVILQIQHDSTLHVVVITGSEDEYFSLGLLNPNLRASMCKEDVIHLVQFANEVFNLIESVPQIVIASINGKIIAGGCELALACDIRYASNQTVMLLPEAGWGGFPGAGAPFRLPLLVGASKALEIIISCEELNAQEMHRLGIVQGLYDHLKLKTEVMKVAKKIASHGPLATKGSKQIIRTSLTQGIEEAAKLSKKLRYELEWSHDVDEGLKAFAEKRKPIFIGK